jgi:hypothetical protein
MLPADEERVPLMGFGQHHRKTLGLPYDMQKRIKKTVVPSRDERLAEIGGPKTPRMGSITPKTVEVPPVGDLLDQMRKATAPPKLKIWCTASCHCPPCERGECGSCLVDSQYRLGLDRETVRASVTKYRGVVFG